MIKNIVFDMGGVLIEFDPDNFIKHLGYDDLNEINYLKENIFYTKIWNDIDAGVISASAGHKMLIDNIDDKYKEDAKLLTEKWFKLSNPINGMPELVKSLSLKGYNLYLLSNAGDNQPSYWNKYPYKDYFNGVYVSAFHKLAKPNEEIYKDFVKEFDLNKEECIFIDDSHANVDAANKFGILSHQFIGIDDLLTFLEELNIL